MMRKPGAALASAAADQGSERRYHASREVVCLALVLALAALLWRIASIW